MSKTFACYLHKPHSFTPELRFVACETAELLADAIREELPSWGTFDAIDVYDAADQPMFRLSRDGHMTQ